MWRAGASCAPCKATLTLVNGVAVSADGRRAVSASDDKTLKVWDVESGRELRTLKGHSDVCLWRGGEWGRAAGGLRFWDKTLKVWDVESGRELRTLEGHAERRPWRGGEWRTGGGRSPRLRTRR